MLSTPSRLLAAGIALGLCSPALAAPATAAPATTLAKYRSCAQLNKDYPTGVGRPGAKDLANGRPKSNPVRNFRVDAKLYRSLPKTLDRDRDGIACEKHGKPKKPSSTPLYTVKGRVITTREALVGFTTPSGNIACDLTRCDILSHSYTPPARPSWCDVEWGSAIVLGRTASFICHGDTVAGAADPLLARNSWQAAAGIKPGIRMAVLPYGWTLRKGAIACTSTTSGVTCRNTTTKHGFTIGKRAYRIF